jgi:hypothetical protein
MKAIKFPLGQGLGIDYQHCDKCNACLPVDGYENHTCIENKFESDCPICHTYPSLFKWPSIFIDAVRNMFHSTQSCAIMRCGHGMHWTCYKKYMDTNYKCPLCAKSIFEGMLLALCFLGALYCTLSVSFNVNWYLLDLTSIQI